VNGEPVEYGKISETHISDKGLMAGICKKNAYKLIRKRQRNRKVKA
jgi:hypothetical protein